MVGTDRKLLRLSRICAMPTHPLHHTKSQVRSALCCLLLASQFLAGLHTSYGSLWLPQEHSGIFCLFVCLCYFSDPFLFAFGGSFPTLIFGLSLKPYAFSAYMFWGRQLATWTARCLLASCHEGVKAQSHSEDLPLKQNQLLVVYYVIFATMQEM